MLKKWPAAVFLGLIITAVLGLVFSAFGLGAGNELMPPFLHKLFLLILTLHCLSDLHQYLEDYFPTFLI